jgi:hypothetical protein
MKFQAWRALWWVAKKLKDICFWLADSLEELENWADRNCAEHV